MDEFVEAIEEGKIVNVSLNYARKEGLPILKRAKSTSEDSAHSESLAKIREENKRPFVEYLQNPKSWKKTQVTSELIDNFHWYIRLERKKKGMSRRQLAKIINEKEENIRLLEAGFLPSNDFVLINKIQQTLGINLRKDKRDFSKGVGDMMKQKGIGTTGNAPAKKNVDTSDYKIEILDEEL